MSHSYEIECPNYKTGCDIENCPRLLDNVDVKLGRNGELVGSGFCTVKGGRYFSGISQEKIKVLAGESTKMNEERERISQMSEPAEKRTALLLESLTRKLKNAPDTSAAAALASLNTAEAAILLYDARKEVAGNRKKHLGGLFFCQFLLNVIDTYFAIIDAAEFYAGTRQIDIHDTPALRMAAKGGFIDNIDSAKKSPANMIRGYLQSGLDNRLIERVFSELDLLLRSLCKTGEEDPFVKWDAFGGFFYQFTNTATDEEMFGPNPAPDIDDLKEELERLSLLFKNLQTALRLHEHGIYDLHPEWGVTFHAGGSRGELNVAKYRRNLSEAFHDYHDKYGNPLEGFETVTAYLRGAFHPENPLPIGGAPFAFLTPTRFSSSYDYSEDLAKLLSTPVCFSYLTLDSGGEDTTAADSPNPWIANAKAEMCEALYDYCQRRVTALPPDSAAKKGWLRAVALLLQSRRNGNALITLTEEKAKAFIEAANDAANEEWIERQTGGGKSMDTPATQRVTDETILRKLDDIAQNQKRGQEEIRGALEANTKATTNLGRKVDAAKSGVKTVTTGLATIFPKLGACTEEEAGKAFGLIPQYVGLDKITNIAHRSQIKAAIDYSYKNGLAVHKPKPDGTTEHPNITDLAETVWGIYEDKWQLIPDSYKTLTDYRSALLHHFGEYPDSLLHCTD